MGIVSAREVAKVMNLQKLGLFGTSIGWLILRTTKLSRLNKEYQKRKNLNGIDFIDSILEGFEIDFEIPEKDLKRIPKSGAFITISNHPLGGIDGMILMKLLLHQRPDYKVIANFLLHRLDPLRPYIMPVNPFEDHKDAKSSLGGIKEAISHLKEGHALGMFPAGEVSTYKDEKLIVDKPWEPAAMKLIQKAKVPVVPIYFHAKNSTFFYKLASMSDILRTAKLPSEMLTQKRRKIKVRIGNPILVEDQLEHSNLEAFTAFLRRKTYMLANVFEKKKLFEKIPKHLKLPKSPKKIAAETAQALMEIEVENCRQMDKRLLSSKNYEVFLAKKEVIPHIVAELGRLREITFRAIGEGTNNATDLDKFDEYYYHLFLWDNEAKKVAGAYRMGMGNEIYARHGIDGFYLQELFRFEPELHKMMSQSIEMGRAFIIKEYQQKPMPLFLLWKGIVHCTLRFPEHKYLIGGVSISNKFSNFSKSLMIEFMKSHYFDPNVAQYIKPKKEFKVKLKDADKDLVFDASDADLNKFDKIIDEIEPENMRLPVLIKKYIKQNAKVVAFNVDPLFNNAVDGLMYIKIEDLPESTVKPVMEEFQKELEEKFNSIH
ncbi:MULTISPECIES: GNAT family N-acyltransferase [Salegentibacter]|jgi:putative hemolysin|uniref:Putative hemolysin n=1 Tax=Salegentibacter agarivorans TaxID=345907 RepID=A0A1I2PCG1_9FLAO|nr:MULTISPECIES: lysophospholipid acyltransferase family protein [Salegentibacter]APS38306.1 glycerol acyltransferase [Salegentibacter sp. T436]MBO2543811.1 lysophospholipid acyltransferase family protein [Salegentibacter sp. BDJ18]SFG13170.1 Putative hemolysin [Salegentibacter agarivorans]